MNHNQEKIANKSRFVYDPDVRIMRQFKITFITSF